MPARRRFVFDWKTIPRSRRLHHCKVRLISRTGPTSNQIERAVQYTYRLYQAKQDSTPNEPALSREIVVAQMSNDMVTFHNLLKIFLPGSAVNFQSKPLENNNYFVDMVSLNSKKDEHEHGGGEGYGVHGREGGGVLMILRREDQGIY